MFAVGLIVAGTGAAIAQEFSAEGLEAIRTVIVDNDFVCPKVDQVIGPTAIAEGTALRVDCGDLRYTVVITPSGQFLVRLD
jgi:hypothetical protein